MPIYEFVCQSCSNEFENIQSFSDPSVPLCPNCGNQDVERQMGRPAIHFKGSGWYINDSKKANKTSANGKSKSGDKEKKTSGKADSGAKESAGSSSASSSDSSSGSGNQADKGSKASTDSK
jgi:putative FmdB family regulatory protein